MTSNTAALTLSHDQFAAPCVEADPLVGALARYKPRLQAERKAEGTICTYTQALRLFHEFLHEAQLGGVHRRWRYRGERTGAMGSRSVRTATSGAGRVAHSPGHGCL